MNKRGRLRVFDRFKATETSARRYRHAEILSPTSSLRSTVIPNINRLAAAFREKRATVIAWVKMTAGRNDRSPSRCRQAHSSTKEAAALSGPSDRRRRWPRTSSRPPCPGEDCFASRESGQAPLCPVVPELPHFRLARGAASRMSSSGHADEYVL